MTPFFYTLIFETKPGDDLTQPLNLSNASAVVANVSGLLTGGLHIFLRTNAISTIGPEKKCEQERQKLKRGIRVWAPAGTTPNFESHSMGYMNGQRSGLDRTDSTKTLVNDRISATEKEEEAVESPKSSPTRERANIAYPDPIQPAAAKTHDRKESYSIFPAGGAVKPASLLPATTYTPLKGKAQIVNVGRDTLKVPPSVRSRGGHRSPCGSL